jgi:hypothetical protein
MNFSYLIGAAAIAITVLTPTSQAHATVVDFNVTGSGFTGSGEITVGNTPLSNQWPCNTCVSGTGYYISSITGTLNGQPIAGLLPSSTYAGNDNAFYFSSPWLDYGDIGFKVGNTDYNIFQGNFGGFPGYYLADSDNGDVYAFPVRFTVSAVPLPGALPLFGSAMLGIGALARRRAKKAT